MPGQPNLVFLLPDQLRYDFLSCYGASFIETPNIDSLAAEGVRYQRAYSAHPVCVPARVSLVSGLHASHTGVLDNGQFLRPDYAACGLQTWPEILNAAGYYTAAIGKMHFYPWDLRLGFQYRSIAEDKRWIYLRDDYYHFLHARGLRRYHGNEHEGYYENKGAIINRLPWECSVDHFVGQEACRFIREHGKDGPFAMMVGFPGHTAPTTRRPSTPRLTRRTCLLPSPRCRGIPPSCGPRTWPAISAPGTAWTIASSPMRTRPRFARTMPAW